jgi:hypothetical protein
MFTEVTLEMAVLVLHPLLVELLQSMLAAAVGSV